MDPITLLWTAIVSGATAAATQTALDQPIRSAYATLRTRLTASWERLTDLRTALHQVDEKPESTARQALLREELENAAQLAPALLRDTELLDAATQLLALLAQSGGTVTAGDRGVAISGAVTNSQIVTGDNSRNIQTGTYIERQEAGNRQIDTGGGTYIGGNAEVGGDFVGRDRK